MPNQRSTPGDGTGLEWGIKESLLSYVGRLPDGIIRATDGATRLLTEGFHFPLLQVAHAGSGTLSAAFFGTVELLGHDGLLYIAVRDPHISIRGDELRLNGIDPLSGERVGIASAELDLRENRGSLQHLIAHEVRLAETAAELFAHQYPEGTELATIRMRIPVQ